MQYKKALVLGGSGMLGNAVAQALERSGCEALTPASHILDACDAGSVHKFLQNTQPEVVIMAAGRVGGIMYNMQHQYEMLFHNAQMALSVIETTRVHDIPLLYVSSSCVYPHAASQPMSEQAVGTGALEATNEGYALAKLVGMRLVAFASPAWRAFSVIPTNLYGAHEFHKAHRHVLTALVQRFVDARDDGQGEVVVWGTGSARREFLHVEDCADAIVFLLQRYDGRESVNIGTAADIRIDELARWIVEKVGYQGRIIFDDRKPDGMMRKLLDISTLAEMGWKARISLDEGLDRLIEEYRALKVRGL